MTWHKKEIAQLKKLWGTMLVKDIAAKLGRTRGSVGYMRERLELPPSKVHSALSGCWYTATEEQFLRDNYMDMTSKELGYHLGRTDISIRNKLMKMDIPRKPCRRDRLIAKMRDVLGEPFDAKFAELRRTHSRKAMAKLFDCELGMLNQAVVYIDKGCK